MRTFRGKHGRSWFRKHSLDIGMGIGFFAFFGLPLWAIMLGI